MVDVPRPWRRWAQATLVADPVGAELASLGWEGGPGPRERLDELRGDRRTALGQYFTPPSLADALVALVDPPVGCSVLDPACGAADLLVAVVRARRRAGATTAEALAGLAGWDVDPAAAWSARAALVDVALDDPRGAIPGPVDIRCQDALTSDAMDVADVVLTNPPYLEAKRMRRAAPGLRERLAARFPQLTRAWDLYLAFAWQALRWARSDVGLVLPNKVCQGRYARPFREGLSPWGLAGLIDASRLSPRPFPKTSVYPVLVHLRCPRPRSVVVSHAFSEADLAAHRRVDPVAFAAFPETPWFVPFDTWRILEPTLRGPRLADVARVASTCSFHKKGLRERYVTPDRPSDHALPYLGGPSHTRRSEVGPFTVDWAGWWIRYDREGLAAIGNPVPPLSTFLRPKIVLRQHALRPTAWVDRQGRFVTKDVYPVGWPTRPDLPVETLAAIVNSTVFAALYNTVYQGIVVRSETYHYLPAFLGAIPVPEPTHPALATVPSAVARQLDGEDHWLAIDRAVARAYGVSEPERVHLAAVHLARVGARMPG